MTAPSAAPARPARATRQGQLIVALGILLVAVTLRASITAVSPLTGLLGDELGLGTNEIGLLGLLPPALFSVVGALTPTAGRRLGLERALVAGIVLTIAGQVLRALTSSAVVFLVGSAVALAGMAMGNVLLPPLVKRYFPHRVGVVTAGYVALISVGAAVPAYLAVPLADVVGWRWALAGWALLAVAAVLPWLPTLRRPTTVGPGVPRVALPVRRSPRAWGQTVTFAMTALNAYSMFAWLPSILRDGGLSEGQAGAMLGLFAAVAIPSGFLVPLAAARLANPFGLMVVFAVCFWAGYAGLIADPGGRTVLWVVVAGLGPSAFPLSLTLINLRTSSPAGSASLSGMVQGLGYAGSAIGPIGVGLLHQATGSWTPALLFLCGTAAFMLAGSWFGCRPGFLEDELGALA